MNTLPAMQQIADALTAAGVPTAIDPRDVQLPGAWLKRMSTTADLLGPAGAVTLRVRVMLIAPDVGTVDALTWLDDLYAIAAATLPGNVGAESIDTTALLPDSATPYPATYWDLDIQLTP